MCGGGVYAGNPAKWICSVEEYYKKRKNLQLEEAKRLAIEYNSRYGKRPSKEIFHEYFMLFKCDDEIFDNKMKLCQNYDDSIKYLTECKPKFDSFEEFIEWCFK